MSSISLYNFGSYNLVKCGLAMMHPEFQFFNSQVWLLS